MQNGTNGTVMKTRNTAFPPSLSYLQTVVGSLTYVPFRDYHFRSVVSVPQCSVFVPLSVNLLCRSFPCVPFSFRTVF